MAPAAVGGTHCPAHGEAHRLTGVAIDDQVLDPEVGIGEGRQVAEAEAIDIAVAVDAVTAGNIDRGPRMVEIETRVLRMHGKEAADIGGFLVTE